MMTEADENGAVAPSAAAPEMIDVTALRNGIAEVPRQSIEWANLGRPFGVFIFCLTTCVVLSPFIVVLWLPELDPESRAESIVNWGTHVLAPVVGFASAVITYYFGTQASSRSEEG